MAGAVSARAQKATVGVRVPQDAYDELVRLQEAWELEHAPGKISLGTIVAGLLADRKPVTP